MSAHLLDLHRTLIHEHAHRLVAWSYRVPGSIDITPNPNGGLEETYWKGRFTMYGRPPSPRAGRLIGLAGALATMVLEDTETDEFTAFEDLDLDEGFSDTDRELVGSYTIADVRAALQRIRRLWADIVACADRDQPWALTKGGAPP